jgi:hypothetical protein
MAKYPKNHDRNFRRGTCMARKIADRESLDYIIECLDDMVDNYKKLFNEKRGDGKRWKTKEYRKAKRQAFTALANVCRSYINLGLDEDEGDVVDWETILTLQSRKGVQKWPDTENHLTERGLKKVA